MIYLHRYTTADDGDTSVEIAVVEEAGHAERYEQRGYRRCDYAAFRADWQMRDAAALAELRKEARPVFVSAPIKGSDAGPAVGKALPAIELGKP